MPKYQEFLQSVLSYLVDYPEAIKIASRTDDLGVLLTLDLHPADMGKVIGRQPAGSTRGKQSTAGQMDATMDEIKEDGQ